MEKTKSSVRMYWDYFIRNLLLDFYVVHYTSVIWSLCNTKCRRLLCKPRLIYCGTELLPEDQKSWNTHLSSLALCSAPPRNEHKQQSCHKEKTLAERMKNGVVHLIKTCSSKWTSRQKMVSLSEELNTLDGSALHLSSVAALTATDVDFKSGKGKAWSSCYRFLLQTQYPISSEDV